MGDMNTMKRSNKKFVQVSAIILGLALIVSAVPFASVHAALEGNVYAAYVATAPTIDGTIDTEWDSAVELTITVTLGAVTQDVLLKFLYDDTYIYVLSQWDDDTMSLVRGAQGYDPIGYSGAWMQNSTNDWIHQIGGSEDRITFMWDINATGFDTSGCMVKCKGTGPSSAYLSTEGEFGDMWHMKAARCLGVTSASQTGTPTINSGNEATAGSFSFLGYTDDKYVTYDEAPHTGDGGRHGDSGSGTYEHNRNSDKSAPIWMESNPTDYIDAMIIRESEISSDCFNVTAASQSTIDAAWAIYDSFDAIVPERILSNPSGSRGDIQQGATWIDGTWTSEMKRELDTGNSDDVIFDPASTDGFLFSIATMDNCGGSDGEDISHFHTAATFYKLLFAEEVVTPPPVDMTLILAVTGIGVVVVVVIIVMMKKKA